MEKYSDITAFEVLVMVAIIYVAYKISSNLYPIIFKRYDDKIESLENDVSKIVSDNEVLENKIENSLNLMEANLKRDLKDVVTEMRALINEFRNYITETEVLKTKVTSLEKRVDKIELKKY